MALAPDSSNPILTSCVEHMSNLVLKQNKVPALSQESGRMVSTVCSQHCLTLWTSASRTWDQVEDFYICWHNQGVDIERLTFHKYPSNPTWTIMLLIFLMIFIDWSIGQLASLPGIRKSVWWRKPHQVFSLDSVAEVGWRTCHTPPEPTDNAGLVDWCSLKVLLACGCQCSMSSTDKLD